MFHTSDALALATFALVVGALATTLDDARFSLWTNALFVWPAVRAVASDAWNEASVFAVTALVSTVHHACTPSARPLAAEMWTLVLATTAIVGVASLATLRLGTSTSFFVGVALAVALAVAAVFAPNDACLGASPALWSTVDFVTAFAALAIIVVYLVAVPRHLELAVFWVFVVVVLVGTLYRAEHSIASMTPVYVWLVVLASVALVARLIECIETPRRRVDYDALDAFATAIVGGGSLALFLTYNTPSTHGWWHVGAALALYLGIVALHRRRRRRLQT